MECRVLNFGYDGAGKPIVPGAHHVIAESNGWFTANKPAENRRHALLCHLWCDPNTPGLFSVHANSEDWATIDPTSSGVTLSNYYNDNDDWLFCRFDGSDLFVLREPFIVPETIIDPFLINGWLVSEGADLSIDDGVLTIQRNSTTIVVRALKQCKLKHKIKNTGASVVGGDALATIESDERISTTRRAIRLVEKPHKDPTPSKPLEIGNAIITNLFPSIPSTMGVGDRIAEAESG